MKALTHSRSLSRQLASAAYCVLVFLLIFLPVTILGIAIRSESMKFGLLLLAGWLCWTFAEYFIHRFWMHNRFRNLNHKVYEYHMYHHRHPDEIKIKGWHRVVLISAGIVLTVFSVIWNNSFTIFLGFYWGFTLYSLLHLILHKKWGRYLFPRVQRAHIHHHGKYPDKGFSFSNVFWDWLFGTLPPKDAQISDKMVEFYFKADRHQAAKKFMM